MIKARESDQTIVTAGQAGVALSLSLSISRLVGGLACPGGAAKGLLADRVTGLSGTAAAAA